MCPNFSAARYNGDKSGMKMTSTHTQTNTDRVTVDKNMESSHKFS